ncbi:MAG: hypothetical protein JWN04_5 [Myxococcaceae bacterium]|nr:hypothetical protein [Myxococcaceae bacterium]
MRLISTPGLGLAPLRGRLDYPGHSLTLIAKVTLALEHGQTAQVLRKLQSFPTGDLPYADEPELGAAPRYESDYAYVKPAADVTVVGHFHAPEGKPVKASEVSVSVNERKLKLAVLGRRRWLGSGPLPGPGQAEPFSTLALRWEHAFGGPAHPTNPVGSGYVAPAAQVGQMFKLRDFVAQPLELPRIERFEQSVTNVEQPGAPLCFAPRARTWPGRATWIGTVDERWQKTRWPWFPDDFDARYFQAAAPELQFPDYLRGDETLRFSNMHPSIALYETRLPGLRAIAAVQRLDAATGALRTEAVPMRLDTLWVDMDAQVAQLVWRGSCACRDADSSDILYAWTDLESVATELSDAEVAARAEQGILRDEAQWVVAPIEPPPAPPPAPEPEPEPAPDELELQLRAALAALPTPSEEPAPPLSPEQQAELERSMAQAVAEAEARYAAEAEPEASNKPPPWTRERVRALRAEEGSLAGLDLSGIDLSGEDFSALDLAGTVFKGTRLDGAIFHGATLNGATFESASLQAADFTGAELEDADLSKSYGSGLVFSDAQMKNANLSECVWPDATFTRTNLELAYGGGAKLERAMFDAALLTEANLERSALPNATFQAVLGSGVRLTHAQLAGARFSDCKLEQGDFSDANLEGASFVSCVLDDVMLERAHAKALSVTDCSVARLRAAEADLTEARLLRLSGKDALFESALLSDASLADCTLHGADFSAATLLRARLQGCVLKKAKFGKADLTHALLVGCDCFENTFEAAQLKRCDGSHSSFFRSEFLDAEVAEFFGTQLDLRGTKLAPSNS